MPVKKTVGKPKTEELKAAAPVVVDEKEAQAAAPVKKAGCLFCNQEKEPTYTDIATLKKFVSDRSKIMPRSRTNVCSKHQRRVSQQIKYARHLSMLSFMNKL